MSYLLKNLIIVLTITLVLGGGYYFIYGGSDAEGTGTATVIDASLKQQTDKILADTKRINEYKLDDSIFSDPRFTSLVNTRIELGQVPTGRPNPFDPIDPAKSTQ